MLQIRKEKTTKSTFIMGIFCGAILMLCLINIFRYFGISITVSGNAATQAYDKTKTIEKCIKKYYQGDYTEEDLANGAAKGMVSSLGDKYSAYYTQSEYDEKLKDINGSYVGIGVTLQQKEEGSIAVTKVTAGGPAQKAGMQAGDIFKAVAGTDLTGKSLNEVVSLIKNDKNEGEKGS